MKPAVLNGLLVCCAASLAVTAEMAAPRITVGPNMLASRDGDFPHVELIVAANPKDANNLVGGAITYTRPGGGMVCRDQRDQRRNRGRRGV